MAQKDTYKYTVVIGSYLTFLVYNNLSELSIEVPYKDFRTVPSALLAEVLNIPFPEREATKEDIVDALALIASKQVILDRKIESLINAINEETPEEPLFVIEAGRGSYIFCKAEPKSDCTIEGLSCHRDERSATAYCEWIPGLSGFNIKQVSKEEAIKIVISKYEKTKAAYLLYMSGKNVIDYERVIDSSTPA